MREKRWRIRGPEGRTPCKNDRDALRSTRSKSFRQAFLPRVRGLMVICVPKAAAIPRAKFCISRGIEGRRSSFMILFRIVCWSMSSLEKTNGGHHFTAGQFADG